MPILEQLERKIPESFENVSLEGGNERVNRTSLVAKDT